MKPGSGKRKGAGFEREVCRKLSLWVSRGKRDDLYWRSAMSGGRASVRAKTGKRTESQLGDISAVDSKGEKLRDRWVIEVKCGYPGSDVLGNLFNPKSLLRSWMAKLSVVSCRYERFGMLIYKPTRRETLAIFESDQKAIRDIRESFLLSTYICVSSADYTLPWCIVPFDELLQFPVSMFY